MNSTSAFDPHLVVRDWMLLPGAEWQPSSASWLMVGVATGVAYWMHFPRNQELDRGALLLIPSGIKGTIRSSQLAETKLRFFQVNPELLTGLITIGDQRWLQQAASHETPEWFRYFPFQSPPAEKFQRLCETRNGSDLLLRLQLLLLFLEALGPAPWPKRLPGPAPDAGARARLVELLNEVSASELMKMDFEELAQKMCCTPRHLSRTFHDVVGVSFRQKQAETRLNRAQELLATTRSKVLDVALESGYQSLSLFNLMFKRRFGITPAKFRQAATRMQEKPILSARCKTSLASLERRRPPLIADCVRM